MVGVGIGVGVEIRVKVRVRVGVRVTGTYFHTHTCTHGRIVRHAFNVVGRVLGLGSGLEWTLIRSLDRGPPLRGDHREAWVWLCSCTRGHSNGEATATGAM